MPHSIAIEPLPSTGILLAQAADCRRQRGQRFFDARDLFAATDELRVARTHSELTVSENKVHYRAVVPPFDGDFAAVCGHDLATEA